DGLHAMESQTDALLIGFAAAFITGLFACKWMIALVQHAKLKYFAWYCFAIALTAVLATML
ncbi:MAG TPA: undecaprenyl-diphosphate phosphatase, partial [Phaeodactylibacter sp.]|nr:undecaprenyl-diphosphate phosphatase [Phaeodactylibacter sp.]